MRLLTSIVIVALVAHSTTGQSLSLFRKPVKTIVDTDIGPWADDVGTLAMLYKYMDEGLIEILGIVGNNGYEGIAAVIDVMNTYFNYPDIAVGVTKDPTSLKNTGTIGWIDYVIDNFPHPKYTTNDQAEDAVAVYRRLLNDADDKSVVITSIGYFTNLVHLLNSKPDQYSPLGGSDLVRRKVKRMIAMAGEFPSGSETNIIGKPQEAREFLRKWTLPITFVGAEIGNRIKCGANLLDYNTKAALYPNSPVAKMYEMSYTFYGYDGCYDHSAAILLAKSSFPGFRTRYGNIYLNETGYNTWRSSFLNIWTLRNHVELTNDAAVLEEINSMLVKEKV